MARWLDMLRSNDQDSLGKMLIRLADEAASIHRIQDAAERSAATPSTYQAEDSPNQLCRIEGLDPRTAAEDVCASGMSFVVTDDDESLRSTKTCTSRHREVER